LMEVKKIVINKRAVDMTWKQTKASASNHKMHAWFALEIVGDFDLFMVNLCH
jgi:hypothetical protein